jgi:hypothetical protein
MYWMMKNRFSAGMVFIGILATITGCSPQMVPSPQPPVVYSAPELKYLLISEFKDIFYVDPDFYPIAREGQEEQNALEQFPDIRADAAEFAAILNHLGLSETAEFTFAETLAIYREHKKLTLSIELTPSGEAYTFVLRTGEGNGQRVEGRITISGRITVLKREPSFNTFPICLAAGTLIDTPAGLLPVEHLKPGMSVWSPDEAGQRIAAVIERTSATPVPANFQVVQVTLSDGRSVTASAGHPTAERRALGSYETGEILDGAMVVESQSVTYAGGATYDLMSSGRTGLYWADGILLGSTLGGH